MKLATYLDVHTEQKLVGLVDASARSITNLQALHRNLFGHEVGMLSSMLSLMDDADRAMDLLRRLEQVSRTDDSATIPLADVKLLAPVPRPRQLREFSVYPQHLLTAIPAMAIERAKYFGLPVPRLEELQRPLPPIYYETPIYYHCNASNVIGTGQPVVWPSYASILDYELELAMFIGRPGRNISAEKAAQHIFGYTIFNDVSARDQMFKEMEMQLGPTKGKSFDTGTVLGPWLVTRDEIPDVQGMTVEVHVNDERVSANTTGGMVHSFEDMVAYASRDETLFSGEMFGSGTIPTCCGLEINRFVAPGDVVRLTVSGIGSLVNPFVKPNQGGLS